jgi:hypothetical protein
MVFFTDIKMPFPKKSSEDHDCRGIEMEASLASRTLHFHSQAQVYEIPHFEDFTREIADLWHQVPDYNAMAAGNLCTRDMMQTGRLSNNDDEFCGRGFEHRMPDSWIRRLKSMQAARDSVIDEQDFQRIEEAREPESLAEVYSAFYTRALCIARTKGLEDEKEVPEVEKSAADNNTKRRRSITFSSNVKVREIVHLSEFSKEEICERWYQNNEYKNIKEQRKVIARILQSRNFQEDGEYVMRGLECMTSPANSRARMLSKLLTLESVLAEQDLQTMEGRSDPERLARVCRKSTLHCAVAAHRMGESDELAIDIYAKEEHYALQQLSQANKLVRSEAGSVLARLASCRVAPNVLVLPF